MRVMQKCMSMEVVELSLVVWRSKMWETTLESTGNGEKILCLLSEVSYAHPQKSWDSDAESEAAITLKVVLITEMMNQGVPQGSVCPLTNAE